MAVTGLGGGVSLGRIRNDEVVVGHNDPVPSPDPSPSPSSEPDVEFDVSRETLDSRLARRLRDVRESGGGEVKITRSDDDVMASSPAGGAGLGKAASRFTGIPEDVIAGASRKQIVEAVNVVSDARQARNAAENRARRALDVELELPGLGRVGALAALAVVGLAAVVLGGR